MPERHAPSRSPESSIQEREQQRALVVEQAALTGTCACGPCCAEIAAEILPERRQVVEVVIQRAVTEYRIVRGTCTCGRVQRSAFPEGVTVTVQYGPGVLALAV